MTEGSDFVGLTGGEAGLASLTEAAFVRIVAVSAMDAVLVDLVIWDMASNWLEASKLRLKCRQGVSMLCLHFLWALKPQATA